MDGISTFVFLDLEATGLDVRTHITEIALVAVHRSALKKSSECRVMDKLSLCVNPVKPVSAGSAYITGLDNYNLEFQKEFDHTLAEMLNLFLQRHKPPVCLVAHNGMGYDFGLLKSELGNLGCTLPQDLLCVDSLDYFRHVDGLGPMFTLEYDCDKCGSCPVTPQKGHKALDITQTKSSLKRKLFQQENDPIEDGDTLSSKKGKSSSKQPSKQQMKLRQTKDCSDEMVTEVIVSAEEKIEAAELRDETYIARLEEEVRRESLEATPPTPPIYSPVDRPAVDMPWEELEDWDALKGDNEPSDDDLLKLDLDAIIHSSQNPSCPDNSTSEINHSHSSEQKQNSAPCCYIHPLDTPTKLKMNPKPPTPVPKGTYKLREVYKRLMLRYPDHEHKAEHDCMSILDVFRTSAPDVLSWCDSNAIPFANIPFRYKPLQKSLVPAHVLPF